MRVDLIRDFVPEATIQELVKLIQLFALKLLKFFHTWIKELPYPQSCG